MQIVDLKCELRDPALAELILRHAGAAFLACISQTDTYYRVLDSCLLRRDAFSLQPDADAPRPASPPDWLHFSRPRRSAPRVCFATQYTDRQAKARFGSAPLPLRVIVQKERSAWVLGDVRINLDDVASLGRFAEFEARVGPRRPVRLCTDLIRRARAVLAPALGEPLSGGYADLMESEQACLPGVV